jgi:hypothetical protein
MIGAVRMIRRTWYPFRIGVALGACAGVLSLPGVLATGMPGISGGVFALVGGASSGLQSLVGLGLLLGCGALYGLAGSRAVGRTSDLRAGAAAGLVAGLVTGLIGGIGTLIVAFTDPSLWQTALGGDVDREVIPSTALLVAGVGLALNALCGAGVGAIGGLRRRERRAR